MQDETSASSKAPRKAVRKVTATPTDLRAPEYARKSTTLSKAAPTKKASVRRPRKRTVHLVGRKTSMFEDPEDAEEEAPEEIPVVMDDNDPNSAATSMAAKAAEAKAARNRPPPVPQLRTQAEKMAFLVSTVQGMEKNIQEIMQNQKSLERVGETKFHNMDVKVTKLTTILTQLQREVDSV
ncbi:hypothetical protein D1007_25496 [Hordeum vulgare]|nr:hypothetical protein D1007_25496 [Hordeum vulgare]